MAGLFDQASNLATMPMGASRKRKSCSRTKCVAETLAMWKDYNKKLDALNDGGRPTRHVHAKGSKKGCMKGKGGPENRRSNYRGVRQRTWGKWVAEIRQPHGGNRLWLGTFPNAVEAALAYDEAARAIYGSTARLNLPDYTCKESSSASSGPSISCCDSILTTTTTSNHTEACDDKDPAMGIDNSEMKCSDVESGPGAHNCRYPAIVEAGMPMTEVKEEPVEIKKELAEKNEEAKFNLEQGILLDEMFDVEELLQSLNSDTFPDQETNTGWCYDNGHDVAQYVQNSEFNVTPFDLSIPSQNPDQEPPDMNNALAGYDHDLDFLLPARQEDYNFSLDEFGLFDMDASLGL